MFLDKNEHVILYETVQIPYTIDELKRLYECGVRTMLTWAYWYQMEPKPGEYNWSRVEKVIERCDNAGLKLIINAPANAPCGYPKSWYLRDRRGNYLNRSAWGRGFSYWNKDALAYRDYFTEMFCKKFSSENVLCASSFYHEGEYFMHPDSASFYDDAAIDSLKTYINSNLIKDLNGYIIKFPKDGYLSNHTIHSLKKAAEDWLKESLINFALRSQKIYAEHNVRKELWQQLHWMLDIHPHCGTYFLDDLYKLTEDATKCDVHQLFCVGYGELTEDNKCQPISKAWAESINYGKSCDSVQKWLDFKNNKGVKNIWLGACWAEGLKKNTMNAIENKMRGLLCAPLHPFQGFERMKKWQFDNFAWAIKQWEKNNEI